MNSLNIAVTKTTMRVVSLAQLALSRYPNINFAYPGKDTALREQATVHLLPTDAIVLHNWLVGYSEGTADRKAPICRI